MTDSTLTPDTLQKMDAIDRLAQVSVMHAAVFMAS
jgi:hypothetical protein